MPERRYAWTSLTMSPHCDDEKKYGVVDQVVADYQALAKSGGEILGRKIIDVNAINGARVTLDDGSWVLVRASSNNSRSSASTMCRSTHTAVPPWPRFMRGCVAYRQSLDEQAPGAATHDAEYDDRTP